MFAKDIYNGIIFVSNFMKDFTNIDEMLLCYVLSDIAINAIELSQCETNLSKEESDMFLFQLL